VLLGTRCQVSGVREEKQESWNLDVRKGRKMDEKYQRLLEATKALVNHIDTEHVFDKGVQTGRGAFDTSRSEELDDLVEKARKAVRKAEDGITS